LQPIPIRSPSGTLDCPRCGTLLTHGKFPFYIEGNLIGKFDSRYCEVCNYSLLTASGYSLAVQAAAQFGFLGPREAMVLDTRLESLPEFILVAPNMVGANLSALDEKRESWTLDGQVLIPNHRSGSRPSTRTEVLITQ
jgi:hypothetical protein